jgi:hypothetical protein
MPVVYAASKSGLQTDEKAYDTATCNIGTYVGAGCTIYALYWRHRYDVAHRRCATGMREPSAASYALGAEVGKLRGMSATAAP